jgi:hypothetical protein
MKPLTFGTDPEYFFTELIDNKEYAVPIPHLIENLGVKEIGYDSERKHPVIYKCKDFKLMMDGVACEANPKPSKTANEMNRDIQTVLSVMGDFANRFNLGVSISPAVFYDYNKWFNPESRAFSWCGIFGCDRDYDAILDNYNSPEIDVVNHPYRYGGGHLHISDENELIKDYPQAYIRLLAMTVGNYSISSSTMPNEEKLRMFKYGQPGRFRVQKYPDGNIGVEYRSPSNLWTTKIDSIEGVMYWANKAYELLNDQDRAITAIEAYLDLSVEAIQQVDQEKAGYILSKL